MSIPKFDPFAALRENPGRDEKGNIYPGEMLKRQMLDAEAIISGAKTLAEPKRQQIIDAALGLMNWWARYASSDDDEDQGECLRRSTVSAFMAGWQASLLVRLTADDVTREQLEKFAAIISTQRATAARTEPVARRREAIRVIWASGKFNSRDRCAEEEWEELGFPSLRQARNALNGTPTPTVTR